MAEPEVAPDNNAAERSLRPLVISRKISGGTRSNQGTDAKMTLSSLFGTWRAQGQNPLTRLPPTTHFPSTLNSYGQTYQFKVGEANCQGPFANRGLSAGAGISTQGCLKWQLPRGRMCR